MVKVLARWNFLSSAAAVNEILPCCGSRAWAAAMVARRPLPEESALLAASDEIWRSLAEADWLEAFRSHPRIGESRPGESQSVAWSTQEQRGVVDADDGARVALADGNRTYERRFNRIFIVCATGKSSSEMLALLKWRMTNDAERELPIAVGEQRKITGLRLAKLVDADE